MDILATPEQVAGFYADQRIDLGRGYAALLARNGVRPDMPHEVLTAAAARILANAVNALHRSFHLTERPLELFTSLLDPLKFAFTHLRTHVIALCTATLRVADL